MVSDTPETDKAKCKFTSLFGDDEDAYWVPLKVASRLERERDSERALADRLAGALTNPATYVALEALTAWKEGRSE